MNFLSTCSGIEAASVAWGPLGWRAVAFSETDAFPRALLAHRYPEVPNLGDMTKFEEWPDEFKRNGVSVAIDVLCGGTPCQSFSLAGLREGLGDPRGNLMLTFGHVAAKYRPRWLVWENVPGVLSSHGGRDFAALLGLLTGQKVGVPAGGWQRAGFLAGIDSAYGVAWRVIDAQYFGLAQRRERVFLVGHLGDWRAAAAVLLERESLLGDSSPRSRARQDAAGSAVHGTGDGRQADPGPVATLDASYGRLQGASGQDANHGHSHLVAGTLRSTDGGVDVTHAEAGHLVFGGNNTTGPIGVAPAVREHGSFHGDFESEAFIAYDPNQITSKGNASNPKPGLMHTLPASEKSPLLVAGTVRTHTRPGSDTVGSITPVTFPSQMSGTQTGGQDGASQTLNATSRMAVAFKAAHFTRGKDGAPTDTAPTLSADADKGDQDNLVLAPYAFQPRIGRNGRGDDGTDAVSSLNAQSGSTGKGDAAPCVAYHMGVRRFTPLECERLQGFPDHYTLIPYRPRQPKDFDEWYAYLRSHLADLTGDEAYALAADGPRYKAIGNSWAIPCVRWIGQRIELVESILKDRA
jgi:DNA (cytosine-5)-methyltransferase 1